MNIKMQDIFEVPIVKKYLHKWVYKPRLGLGFITQIHRKYNETCLGINWVYWGPNPTTSPAAIELILVGDEICCEFLNVLFKG